MKKTIYFLFTLLFAFSACKKDKEVINTDYAILTEEEITDISSGASELAVLVQTSMLSYVSIAFDSGYYITYPEMEGKKSTTPAGLKNTAGDWSGPDANGWYTRHMDGAYEYTERVRCCDTLVEYEYIISYDGADGSYESINKTQYEKYIVNGKELYRGYWDWSVSNSGYNDISDTHWKMTFEDWDPDSNAGEFDWWWGANSNGNFTTFSRYLNIIATDAGDEWLNVKVTMYANNTESWSFEYTTPWSPVEMPDLHTCSVASL